MQTKVVLPVRNEKETDQSGFLYSKESAVVR